MASPAVFIERDNVLIADPGYMGGRDAVKLLPGVELAIKSLRQAGYKIVVVTNQPGVARGLISEDALEAAHSQLREVLADKAARLDAIYYCPNHPGGSVERYAQESDNRMPKAGMLRQAAEEMQLDLDASWIVGSTAAAIGAGQHAGCRTVRIKGRDGKIAHEHDGEQAGEEFPADYNVRNLVDAARTIMREGSSRDASAEADSASPARPKTPVEQPSTKPAEQSAEEAAPPKPSPARPTQPGIVDVEEPPIEESAAVVEEPDDDESPPHGDALDQAAHAARGAAAPSDAKGDVDSEVRKEILRHVRQMVRQQDTHEFSLTNVVGGIAQMFAGLGLLLAIIMAVGYEDMPRGTFWALVAILFQTTSLTFFVMGRNNR